MASRLLNIPLEIREEIIAFVVFSKQAPPEDPSTAPQNRLPLKNSDSSNNVLYDQEYNDTPANLPLLLVNRQLSAETRTVLDRCPSLSYHIDLMLVDGGKIWLTWLSVPALSRRVDNVVTTLRVFGANSGRSSVFRGGDGGPPQIVWTFYNVLIRFLESGPAGKLKPGAQGKGFVINTLTMNFVTRSSGVNDSSSEHATFRDGTRDELRQGSGEPSRRALRPDWLCSFLRSHIGSLLGMDYHTARYGAILYERIGSIRFCVDGVLYKNEVNLGERLAGLRYTDYRETFGELAHEERLPHFWRWKKEALAKRRAAGLPVVEAPDPELNDVV